MTSLLLETPLDPQQREYAETIRASGEVLLTVIDDILDFSKVEAGKLTLEARPFDLSASVETVLNLLAPRAAERGLVLTSHVAEDVPRLLVGDEVRIRQIMLNLVGNALKFTEHGRVELRVARSSHLVTIAVADTGIGIPPEEQPRLFTRFFRSSTATERAIQGTGLGLVIVKNIVDQHGGEIAVESAAGEGTTVTVTLPLIASTR
jgi:signal transduction histidine kinase